MRILCLILAFSLSCILPERPDIETTSKSSPIIGGWTASLDFWSFYVSLQTRWGHLCGGVLVQRDVVLTAAHCVDEASEYEAVFVDGTRSSVARWLVHPDYDPHALGVGDYALGYLVSDAPASFELAPLNRDSNYPYDRQVLYAAGRGYTAEGELPEDLLETSVGEVPYGQCVSYYPRAGLLDGKTQICAGYRGQGVCSGDSGGPLADASGLVVGLVSWGVATCEGSPMVFMRLSPVIDWILVHS